MIRLLAFAFLALALPMNATAEKLPPVSELPSKPNPPDPLVMYEVKGGQMNWDGPKVETKQQWAARREQLKRLVNHYMYGFAPPAPQKVTGRVMHENPKLYDGKATLREVLVKFGDHSAQQFHLLVVTPNNAQGRVPVFLGTNFRGNHTFVSDQGVKQTTSNGRNSRAHMWAIPQTIKRGYAVATIYYGEIDPDKNDFSNGIHPAYYKKGQKQPGPHEWGAIAAWAFGLSRAADYLVQDESIDAERMIVFGHSRLGKTALLAGALDERFAAVIPHQSGCGGASLSRHPVGESVKQINDRFPHWFNDTFKKFNEQVDRLPFDQHSLVALCAPRPVLFSNAVEDKWADPQGQFLALKHADPVYRLLGVEGLTVKKMPPLGKLSGGRLAYFIRPGRHSTKPEDWQAWLKFADRHLKK